MKKSNNKLLLIVLIATAINLTACEKTNTATEKSSENLPNSPTATTVLPSTNADTSNSHTGHDMNAMTASNTSQPAHIMAYMDMMSKMHQDMSAGVQAKNADVAFAQGMVPHHQGAVEMAKIELQYGKDKAMKALAQNVINTQQGEIEFMQTWLTKDTSPASQSNNIATAIKAYEEKNSQYHNAMMQGVMDNDPDVAFVKGMIPHHQGAIAMADVELKNGKNPDMLKLAKQIKSAQDPEIKQMQAWLKAKGQ